MNKCMDMPKDSKQNAGWLNDDWKKTAICANSQRLLWSLRWGAGGAPDPCAGFVNASRHSSLFTPHLSPTQGYACQSPINNQAYPEKQWSTKQRNEGSAQSCIPIEHFSKSQYSKLWRQQVTLRAVICTAYPHLQVRSIWVLDVHGIDSFGQFNRMEHGPACDCADDVRRLQESGGLCLIYKVERVPVAICWLCPQAPFLLARSWDAVCGGKGQSEQYKSHNSHVCNSNQERSIQPVKYNGISTQTEQDELMKITI